VDDGTRGPPVPGEILIARYFIHLQVEDQRIRKAPESAARKYHTQTFKINRKTRQPVTSPRRQRSVPLNG